MRHGHHSLRDLDFAGGGAMRENLQRVPVAVAAAEVHDRVHLRGVLAQYTLGDVDLLEERAPVQRVEEPNTGDRVGDRDLVGGLQLLRLNGGIF